MAEQQVLIGTYSEKTVHALLKQYFEPDSRYHEVKYAGYIADIKHDNRIVEIQSTQLYRLRKKLAVFCQECEVNVVYPVCWFVNDMLHQSAKNYRE